MIKLRIMKHATGSMDNRTIDEYLRVAKECKVDDVRTMSVDEANSTALTVPNVSTALTLDHVSIFVYCNIVELMPGTIAELCVLVDKIHGMRNLGVFAIVIGCQKCDKQYNLVVPSDLNGVTPTQFAKATARQSIRDHGATACKVDPMDKWERQYRARVSARYNRRTQ